MGRSLRRTEEGDRKMERRCGGSHASLVTRSLVGHLGLLTKMNGFSSIPRPFSESSDTRQLFISGQLFDIAQDRARWWRGSSILFHHLDLLLLHEIQLQNEFTTLRVPVGKESPLRLIHGNIWDLETQSGEGKEGGGVTLKAIVS
jgi:hypothetical protein